jgi:hypothetical protein
MGHVRFHHVFSKHLFLPWFPGLHRFPTHKHQLLVSPLSVTVETSEVWKWKTMLFAEIVDQLGKIACQFCVHDWGLSMVRIDIRVVYRELAITWSGRCLRWTRLWCSNNNPPNPKLWVAWNSKVYTSHKSHLHNSHSVAPSKMDFWS